MQCSENSISSSISWCPCWPNVTLSLSKTPPLTECPLVCWYILQQYSKRSLLHARCQNNKGASDMRSSKTATNNVIRPEARDCIRLNRISGTCIGRLCTGSPRSDGEASPPPTTTFGIDRFGGKTTARLPMSFILSGMLSYLFPFCFSFHFGQRKTWPKTTMNKAELEGTNLKFQSRNNISKIWNFYLLNLFRANDPLNVMGKLLAQTNWRTAVPSKGHRRNGKWKKGGKSTSASTVIDCYVLDGTELVARCHRRVLEWRVILCFFFQGFWDQLSPVDAICVWWKDMPY